MEDRAELNGRVDDFFADPERLCDDSNPLYCRQLVKAMGAAGLLEAVAPQPSSRALCLLRQRIAYHSALGDLLFAMQGLGSHPICLEGSAAQKQQYLSRVARGEAIAAFAITEPDAGSDVGSLKLRAEKTNDGYILNGVKTLISNAGLADFYTLFARTSEGPKGITAFILDASNPGLRVQPQELIGSHPIGQLHLENAAIPDDRRLGAEGDGLKIAYATLDVFRSSVGAAALGMAERAFDEAVRYAKSRVQFGKPLAEMQGIQFKIAEMAQLLQASRLLVWDAASKKDDGSRTTLESAIAKSYATEAAQKVIDEALQIHGGAGLLRGSITERLYRDIRALRIYEGTTEVLKTLIAREFLK
jgi:alkylation response protein AidB-like acyl-CoA dehydrogenase